MKEMIEQSNLMLSDDEICNVICEECSSKNKDECPYYQAAMAGIRAELDHLKGLGIVYVKKWCPYRDLVSNRCNVPENEEYCPKPFYDVDSCYIDIPLSDYKGQL